MNNRRVVILGVLALGIIGFLCVRVMTPDIEKDLLSRSSAALEANRIPSTGLTFDGRDALLSGVKGSAEVSDQARHVVEDVWGVRAVQVDYIAGQLDPIQPKLNQVLQGNVVEFIGNSALLTPHGRAVLDKVVPILASSSSVPVEIRGATLARAAAVKDYLAVKGIERARLSTAASAGGPIEFVVAGGK
jgi:outer membrane protein OmpA-like peptidoglycan-associated protein